MTVRKERRDSPDIAPHNADVDVAETPQTTHEMLVEMAMTPVGMGMAYEDLVKSLRCEIVAEGHDDDYQGDSFYLLRVGSYYGFLRFGWGSCSGCDALQACDTDEEVQELRMTLFRQTVWMPTASRMLRYFMEKDYNVEWYGDKEAFKTFHRAAVAHLQKA